MLGGDFTQFIVGGGDVRRLDINLAALGLTRSCSGLFAVANTGWGHRWLFECHDGVRERDGIGNHTARAWLIQIGHHG